MSLKPVLSEAGICYEWHVQGEGILHLFDDDTLHFLLLLREDGEVKFVVNLQDHLTLDALGLETLMDADHRHLDDISSCSLDGGVDGITLSKATDGGVVGVDIWKITTTPKEGGDVALLTSHLL